MRDHTGDRKGFYHLSRAWYGPVNLARASYDDEVLFGYYTPKGGTSGEMGVRWVRIGSALVPQLLVWDDAWHALATFGDVLALMGERDSENITPTLFCHILRACGFTDLTHERSPDDGQHPVGIVDNTQKGQA